MFKRLFFSLLMAATLALPTHATEQPSAGIAEAVRGDSASTYSWPTSCTGTMPT
ncbi:MAG: hypothetical protein IKN21_02225 [Prevotella sp.]|nr:hypothetical protein [Prevotella sp.]